MHRTARIAATLLAALLLAGCTGTAATPPDVPRPSPSRSEPPPPASPVATPLTVDVAPGGDAVALGDGWSIQHCEGDAPLLCVRDADGTVRGLVEMNVHPGSDAVARAEATGEVLPVLEDVVAAQHTAVAADRTAGCGEDYQYRAEPTVRTTVGGAPAVLYAFTGTVDGVVVEAHRAWYTVHDELLWTVNAAAAAAGSCMADPELSEFTPEDLALVTPWLDRVVAGSELPPATR